MLKNYIFSKNKKAEFEKRYATVYMIQNMNNGKKYIGQSRNVDLRMRSHITSLRKGKHFCKDMQLDFDNGDSFEFTIIFELPFSISKGILNAVEWACIMENDSYKRGYNTNYPYWSYGDGESFIELYPEHKDICKRIKSENNHRVRKTP